MNKEELEKEIEKIFFDEIYEAVGKIIDRVEKAHTTTNEVVEVFLRTYEKTFNTKNTQLKQA